MTTKTIWVQGVNHYFVGPDGKSKLVSYDFTTTSPMSEKEFKRYAALMGKRVHRAGNYAFAFYRDGSFTETFIG
ncbi:hypothetical protein FsymDg_4366 [Candidatus Protofrankia datiscae]|uniref:Uncharacterized protein n=1 Tax=Candidatus Protofrankia datiscae TaxID=2716812 RepID=F8AYP4_9ACTN|nr:hypothetical protein [Candidatus Protofrankia datiscae]AEH07697.1 hypothetical protein FsymDg_0116 [Candidatus Protofrankia datiscae]AEH11619.1 hypothetical protein FsymDg_4366 [Candidatus Protofrankia datiscae]